ncbi:hypothetical protein DM02DRAFT_644636 [Periconia macrospinosa]|uniref:BTB domain-containing protein n=1 Tax=Periconia macrospinosa TaxID=97972 RepID=A0A2V1DHH4_9PLEO|nr:hypothetical protein DM02DRAFT_644636 [Periconia macrospinosa]
MTLDSRTESSTAGSTQRSIPSTLPPPYTSTGRVGSLRAQADSFTTTAQILVGSKSTPFQIHTALLTNQSPYFRACLTGPFLEATQQSITLADVSVELFELLVTWLYQAALNPVPFKDGKPAYYTLLNLWILADRLCFEGLRNYIVDLMSDLADSTNSVLTPSDTRILYDQIREDAKIRELVLDLFAFKKTDKLLDTHQDRWHAGFLRDLVVRLKKPCEQAMQRHQLSMWCPSHWHTTRACDNCRVILPPRYGAVGCDICACAFCVPCVEEGVGIASWEDGRPQSIPLGGLKGGPSFFRLAVSASGASASEEPMYMDGEKIARLRRRGAGRKMESCKPWRGSRCKVYHEHRETEACGDVFMGR